MNPQPRPTDRHHPPADAYYGEDGEPCVAAPAIACDLCGADCFEESWYYAGIDELDICPACFTNAQAKGHAGPRFAGAEHQMQGVRVAKPKRPSGKRAAGGGGKKSKK